jgi:hypothetical protein
MKPELKPPPLFDAVLLKALAKAPEARFETMAAFAEALRGAFDGEIPAGPDAGLVPKTADSVEATRVTPPDGPPTGGSTLATVAIDSEPSPDRVPDREGSIRSLITFAILGGCLALVGLGSTAMSWTPDEPSPKREASREPREFGVADPSEALEQPEPTPDPEPVKKSDTPLSLNPAISEAIDFRGRALGEATTAAEEAAEAAAENSQAPSADKAAAPAEAPTPASGVVQATLIPWGDLFVDGKRLGRGSRIRTELPAGRHTLQMRQGERAVAKQVVRIRAGQTTTVEMVAK